MFEIPVTVHLSQSLQRSSGRQEYLPEIKSNNYLE